MAKLTMRKLLALDTKHLLLLLLLIPVTVFGQKVSKTVPLDGGKIIIFEEPGDVMEAKSYKVEKALEQSFALAKGSSINGVDYFELPVLLFEEGKYFYDEEIVRTPHGKEPRLIGVIKYEGEAIPVTLPVVSFVPLVDEHISKSNESIPTDPNDMKIYEVVEEMPSYPGGMNALMTWLAQNIKYPAVAAEAKVEGRVMTQFVIEKDGSINDVKVIQSVDPSLDMEAVRVVKSMPRWTPGKQNGLAVRVNYTFPLTFKLQ